MHHQYEAVIFDLGGVVLGSPLEGIADYEKQNNIPKNYINVNIVAKGRNGAFQRLERGELPMDEFYKQFHEELTDPNGIGIYKSYLVKRGKPVPSNLPSKIELDAVALFDEMMSKASKINTDMLHALFVLKGSGYKVAALTNNWKTEDDSNSSYTNLLTSWFDLIIESSIVGHRKPSPEIYKLTCQQLDVDIKKCAFLDDIGINLAAAKELGMTTIKVELNGIHRALTQLQQKLNATRAADDQLRLLYDPSAVQPTKLSYAVGAFDGSIVCDAFGLASNQPVVMLHGGGQTRHTWEASARAFVAQGYFVLTVDMKGHGESYWDETRNVPHHEVYGIPAFAADLDRLLEFSGLIHRGPYLVGASLGGLSSLMSQSVARAAALVLVDVTPKLEKTGVDRVLHFMSNSAKDGFSTLEEAAAAIASYQPNRKRQVDDKSLVSIKKNLRQVPETGKWVWHWDPYFMNPRGGPSGEQLGLLQRLIDERAKSITAPTLLVRGKLTDLVSEEGVAALRRAMPHCEFVDVQEASHMVVGDKNDIFCEEVLKFLSRVSHGESNQQSKL